MGYRRDRDMITESSRVDTKSSKRSIHNPKDRLVSLTKKVDSSPGSHLNCREGIYECADD